GQLSGWTDRDGKTTSVDYDSGNRVTTVTDPLEHATVYTADGEDKVVKIVNAKEEPLHIQWSDDREVSRVVEPTGKYTEFAYDDNGYLTDQYDELHNHTQLVYDHLPVDDNDAEGKWRDGRTQAHISQLVSKTDPKGVASAGTSDDFQWRFLYDD